MDYSNEQMNMIACGGIDMHQIFCIVRLELPANFNFHVTPESKNKRNIFYLKIASENCYQIRAEMLIKSFA